MNKPIDLAAYGERADEWSKDRYETLTTQRNWAACIASIALVGVVALSFAIAALAPLKTSEPYLIERDKSTGQVEVLTALRTNPNALQTLAEDDAVIASWLVPYVIARETYDKADEAQRNELVGLFSTPLVAETWRSLFRGDGPENRYRKYGDDQVSIVVTRVAFINRKTAQVAFTSTWRKRGGGSVDGKYVATIPFEFTQTPAKLVLRWKNPLGFRATNYRVDQEIISND